MRNGSRTMAAIGGVVAFVAGAAWAGGKNPPLTTAELLVDSARDYALMQRGHQTATDVQEVRTLLQAAVRLDPKLADAYAWLYELATLSGNRDEAATALAGLLSADPENQNAFALWLAAGARAQQTVEKRHEWLEQVAASPRPPAMQALTHIALARVAIERLDLGTAREQLRHALELEPASPEAAALAVDTLDPNAPAPARLRAMLRLLAVQPLSVSAVWQVGLLLNDYGLAEEARTFYDYGYSLRPPAGRPGTLRSGFLLDLARNRLACGQLDEAIDYARQAVAADSAGAAEAGMYLVYLLDRKGRLVDAGEVRAQLARRFAAITDPQAWPVNEVAQAAWFYCVVMPNQHRAALLADAAAQRAPHDPFVQRVLGWAQAFNRRTDEARQTLAPLAGHDPFAAYMLARLMLEAGDQPGAHRVLAAIDRRPRAGPAHDLLALPENATTASQPTSWPTSMEALATQPISTQPTAPVEEPELRAALAEFDTRVLRFKDDPSRFLEARVVLDDLSPAPGEPWWATFSLSNRGPFPITLAPDAMVNPVFVLSFTMEGDHTRAYPALTTVSVDRVRILYPGQSSQVRRTLDVGPPRHVSQQTPQQVQRVGLQVLLDAEVGPDGLWHPALGGQQLHGVYFNRLPASTGREAIAALFSALSGDSQPARVKAIEVIAELLGERQRAELKRLNYDPAPVPADQLRAALLNLLGDPSWELRVRTLDSLQVVGLDRGMTDAVERCLEHPHWLVRLMAVRVLAREGRPFAERAQTIARSDPDELVRALAQCELAKLTQQPAPAAQPDTQPAGPRGEQDR
jgi:tetratricopeptide (TPR) repeat protein